MKKLVVKESELELKQQKLALLLQKEKLLCEHSFYRFFLSSWSVLNRDIKLINNWHIKYLCEKLQEKFEKQLKGEGGSGLIINVPPKSLKSLICTVAFPAWVWIRKSSAKFITASYSPGLAAEHSGLTTDLLNSDWFKGNWGDLFKLVTDSRGLYRNNKGGHRFTTSPRSALGTGFTADIIIVDDPNAADDRYSDVDRNMVTRWWTETMPTRLNDWGNGIKIVIQQRIDNDDLTGHILKNQAAFYEHISLPGDISDGAHEPVPAELSKYYQDGLLSPIRLSRKILEEMQATLRTAYSGQILQDPIVQGGRYFKSDWIKWFTPQQLPRLDKVILSIDASFTDAETSCPASIQVWGTKRPNYYMLYDETRRMGAEETATRAQVIAKMYPGCIIVIESAANGYFVIEKLKQRYPVYKFDPKKFGGKEQRAESVAMLWQTGNVHIGDTVYNRTKYIEEILAFPNSKWKDRVDAMAMALLYYTRCNTQPAKWADHRVY